MISKERLVEIIQKTDGYYGITYEEAADRILYALKDERTEELAVSTEEPTEPIAIIKDLLKNFRDGDIRIVQRASAWLDKQEGK